MYCVRSTTKRTILCPARQQLRDMEGEMLRQFEDSRRKLKALVLQERTGYTHMTVVECMNIMNRMQRHHSDMLDKVIVLNTLFEREQHHCCGMGEPFTGVD